MLNKTFDTNFQYFFSKVTSGLRNSRHLSIPWNADLLKMKSASLALCKCHSRLNHSVGVQAFHIHSNEKSHWDQSYTGSMTFANTWKITTCDTSVFSYE